MASIGIYYGSDSGNTQSVAKQIASALGVSGDNVFDVSNANGDFSTYDVLLFGTSTMGLGDLQSDWEDFINNLKNADLSGKKVAVFGCGDSSSFSDTFCDGMGEIYKATKAAGATMIGSVSTDGYTYDDSAAVVDGKFVGLPIDEDNESDQTGNRIAAWVGDLKKEI
ncbi:flavodoxin I [Dysgonomonas sp. PH5-45]|uniref:flavodoxin n=1 Tax=unclassified Dysgonomonas TaxID=2630389 RepID=UPI0024738D23|nr:MULTISPECIES: flavodoxin [unclassified Dysgonomonas]MDH6354435.1 flavodoxin I [Dysgonomonas sp. PH5-45]MDH6387334.1 flavodoxin I [Dysgonomonas sp. PH5-37]